MVKICRTGPPPWCWLSAAALLCLLGLVAALPSLAAHGVSLDGSLKYAPGFERFDYTSPRARQGGSLTLHDLGGFDKLNPFTLKGVPPLGLSLYVFETLTVPSLDEPIASYGLLARDISLAPDKRSVTFTLDERARFSDGSQVMAEDVLFSLNTLKGDGAHPFYQAYFHDISDAQILGPGVIRFNFARVNRELHLIAGQLPILSKRFYQQHPFAPRQGQGAMAVPVGSGPYLVAEVKPGKSIQYRKNPNYWAVDHPTRRGMFNFSTITVKYFKDQIVSVEAFKAGEYDLMYVNMAKQWERDLRGPLFERGLLKKTAFPHHNNAGMQGFVFNTRNPLFADRQVRRAIGLAFDFEWTNQALFYNQYTRTNSYFANSELAARGLPSAGELALLEPFREQLPAEVFTTALAPASTAAPGSLRANLRQARQILREQGWEVKDGVLRRGDQEFRFEIILVSPSFERVMAPFVNNLKKLGIEASYRTIDPALYADRLKNFDFEMTVSVFAQSQSPGNEQRDYWTSQAAGRKGSRNLAGVGDPVVDLLVNKVIYASSQAELTAACRALDRVLWYGYYVVPNWYLASQRLAYVSRLQYPSQLPLYYNYAQFLHTWWSGE
ncbi:extracellular solute-binding protein [Desulfogranum mediterraneum]|uniref:extracellular solute-binding protein n=1 Tax=Desulfogranum mediterraneum TaxID=160661 RepID=UPI00068849AA|nr:extracellular solute-binding protein [Desulfogranum mediterraneum]